MVFAFRFEALFLYNALISGLTALQPSSDVISLLNNFHPNYGFNSTFASNDTGGTHNNHHGTGGNSSNNSSKSNGSPYTLLIVGVICLSFILLAGLVVRFRRYKEKQIMLFKDRITQNDNNNDNENESTINMNELSIDHINDSVPIMERSYSESLTNKHNNNNNNNDNNNNNNKNENFGNYARALTDDRLSISFRSNELPQIPESDGNDDNISINELDSPNNDNNTISPSDNNSNISNISNKKDQRLAILIQNIRDKKNEIVKNNKKMGKNRKKTKDSNLFESLTNDFHEMNANKRANNGLVIDPLSRLNDQNNGQYHAIIT